MPRRVGLARRGRRTDRVGGRCAGRGCGCGASSASSPLSWEVGPPSLWGWMWSTSQRDAGSSQPDGCWQCRSRTSIARRSAPVKRPLVGHRDDPVGSVEHDPFQVGLGEQRHDLAGGDDGAGRPARRSGRTTRSPTRMVISGRGRSPPSLAVRDRVAISTRASARRWVAVRSRPVALVVESQLLHQPDELVEEGGAADRVEQGAHVDHPVEAWSRRWRRAVRSGVRRRPRWPSASARCFQYSTIRRASAKRSTVHCSTSSRLVGGEQRSPVAAVGAGEQLDVLG